MEMTFLGDLIGRDEPINPADMRFTVKVAKSCRSCLFDGQRTSVCHQAATVARRADLPDCDDGFVYVPIPIDERQLTLD